MKHKRNGSERNAIIPGAKLACPNDSQRREVSISNLSDSILDEARIEADGIWMQCSGCEPGCPMRQLAMTTNRAIRRAHNSSKERS